MEQKCRGVHCTGYTYWVYYVQTAVTPRENRGWRNIYFAKNPPSASNGGGGTVTAAGTVAAAADMTDTAAGVTIVSMTLVVKNQYFVNKIRMFFAYK